MGRNEGGCSICDTDCGIAQDISLSTSFGRPLTVPCSLFFCFGSSNIDVSNYKESAPYKTIIIMLLISIVVQNKVPSIVTAVWSGSEDGRWRQRECHKTEALNWQSLSTCFVLQYAAFPSVKSTRRRFFPSLSPSFSDLNAVATNFVLLIVHVAHIVYVEVERVWIIATQYGSSNNAKIFKRRLFVGVLVVVA